MNKPIGLTSDHFPICIQIPNLSVDDRTQTINYRKLKDIDLGGFRKELQSEINKINTEEMSFADHMVKLDEITVKLMNKYAPMV